MPRVAPSCRALLQFALFGIIQPLSLRDGGNEASVNDGKPPTQNKTNNSRRSRIFAMSFSPDMPMGRYQRQGGSGVASPLLLDMSEGDDIDLSDVNEAQVLLACRAYLLRKHKVEWKEKKRRAAAASSPLNNEGYFWPDPNELLYLREDPDPYNLIYNETYGEYYGYKRNGVRFLTTPPDTTYSGKNYLEDEEVQPENERVSTSDNPFSTNPLYPDDEHMRRSNAKKKLWNNRTWVEEWYSKRWGDRVLTEKQKAQKKQKKKLRTIDNDVLESPSFDDMTEDEVSSAILTYLAANQRKSKSRLSNRYMREVEREAFRGWREQVKREALNLVDSTEDVTQRVEVPYSNAYNNDMISFSPSIETMRRLKAQRSEKSRRAFQTRLDNRKSDESSSKEIDKLRFGRFTENGDKRFMSSQQAEGEVSPMQAILHIDMALDKSQLPSPTDVEIILKPRRLGRRRDVLRRVLSECFDLRGKCVTSRESDDKLFVTKCSIDELGAFVLTKLRQKMATPDD